jgi:predicted RNase H-like HicB family nuclease
MIFAVALFPDAGGSLRALAPDLPGCDLKGHTKQELLPRLRLAIEAAITERLLTGQPLPDTRDGHPPPGGLPEDLRGIAERPNWLQIHINVAHLVALAAHQGGDRPAR